MEVYDIVRALFVWEGLLIVMFVGQYFVKGLLDVSRPVEWEKTSVKKKRTSVTIGVVERVFVFILMLVGQIVAIGLVLTAKSVARYKDFDKEEFAELYLIGTLSSMLFAVIIGILWCWPLGISLGD